MKDNENSDQQQKRQRQGDDECHNVNIDDDSSHITPDDIEHDDDLDRKPPAKSSLGIIEKDGDDVPQQERRQSQNVRTSRPINNSDDSNNHLINRTVNDKPTTKTRQQQTSQNDLGNPQTSKNRFDEKFQMKKEGSSLIKKNRISRRGRSPNKTTSKSSEATTAPLAASTTRASRRNRNNKDGSKKGLQNQLSSSTPGAFHSNPKTSNRAQKNFSHLRHHSNDRQEEITSLATPSPQPPTAITRFTDRSNESDLKQQQLQMLDAPVTNNASTSISPGAVHVDGPGIDDGSDTALEEYYGSQLDDEGQSLQESVEGISADSFDNNTFTTNNESVINRQYEHHQEQVDDSSMHNLPTANMVDKTETIAHAEEVKKDVYVKPNQVLIILFGLLLFTTILISRIFLFRDSNTNTYARVGDPRCWEPIESQSVAMQCHCIGSAEAAVNRLDNDQRRLADQYVKLLTYQNIIDPNTTEIRFGACDPINQALTIAVATENINNAGNTITTKSVPPENPIAVHVLLLIYVTMGGIDWYDTHGWFGSLNLCSWHGVNCGFYNLISDVSLPNNGLKGSIPSEIQHLGSLEIFDLSHNAGITGTIPTEIGKMRSLFSVTLQGLQLTGTIPSEIGSLRRLEALILNNNQLTGTIPPEILTASAIIELSSNQLNGTIQFPKNYNKLNLHSFSLLNNSLSGTLPVEFESFSSLTLLNLGLNRFTGEIPTILGNLPVLQFLSLYGSGFTGTIPESFCTNTNTIGNVVNNDNGNTDINEQVSAQPTNDDDGFMIDFRTLFLSCEDMEYCSCCSDDVYSNPFVRLICFEHVPPELILSFPG